MTWTHLSSKFINEVRRWDLIRSYCFHVTHGIGGILLEAWRIACQSRGQGKGLGSNGNSSSAKVSDPRTSKITRLPPSDFDFRKRPIGNSGAFFCSAILSLMLDA